MPSRTASRAAPTESQPAPGPSKLRPRRAAAKVAPPAPVFAEEDVEMDVDTNDDENHASLLTLDVDSKGGPHHLDDPWAYTFKPNDRVWVRNHDKWISGHIFPRSVPKIGSNDNIIYWNVFYQDAYGHKLRRYFAPLLGELKPDTARVRKMLKEAHWI